MGTTLLIGLVILVVGLAVTGLLIVLVDRFIPEDTKGVARDSWAIFAFTGVIYALVVGFVLGFALNGWQKAEESASAEADAAFALSRSITLLEAEDRDRIGHQTICYARAVIEDEWPLMAKGKAPSDLTTASSDRLFQSFRLLARTYRYNPGLEASLERLREISEARALRLQASNSELPGIFWLFLIGGGLLVAASAAILTGRDPLHSRFIYLTPVVLLVIGSCYLVFVFERPFSGVNRIEPQSMELALDAVTDFVPDPRADRPCP